MRRLATPPRAGRDVRAGVRPAAVPVPANSAVAKPDCERKSKRRPSKSASAFRALIPEGIVQTSGRESAIGFRLRTRFIGDFLVDKAGRRCHLFVTLARRRSIGIFGFHGRLLHLYDLRSLNTSTALARPQ